MSIHQTASQGRHWILALFCKEHAWLLFHNWPVFVGHWTLPWNGFLGYNLRELRVAWQFEYFADLNFLCHYNHRVFFFKTGIQHIVTLFFSKCSLFLEKVMRYIVWSYLCHLAKWAPSQNGWMILNHHLSTLLPGWKSSKEKMWPAIAFPQAT